MKQLKLLRVGLILIGLQYKKAVAGTTAQKLYYLPLKPNYCETILFKENTIINIYHIF
jgi:hypothetical protein